MKIGALLFALFAVPSFAHAAAVSTDQSSYAAGAAVVVSYSGMSGSSVDWISVAIAGSPDTSYARYVFTGGAINGETSFSGLGAGTWVARAYFDNTYTKEAESATFTIASAGAVSISTNASSYTSGASVMTSFMNLSGDPNDWISVAPAGTVDTIYTQWKWSGSAINGTATFDGLADGQYVARVYFHNSYTKEAESTVFTVGAAVPVSVSADQSAYVTRWSGGDSVTASFAGMPGQYNDYIAITDDGAAGDYWDAYRVTQGATGGTVTFSLDTFDPGVYVLRAYFQDQQSTPKAESSSFTVSYPVPTIGTDMASYAAGSSVIAIFGNMYNSPYDWIGIAAAGSADDVYLAYQYTGGSQAGAVTFDNLPTGDYVARVYFSNTYTKRAETSFTINP